MGYPSAKHKSAWPPRRLVCVPETARYEVFSDHYFAEYREKPHPLAGLAFDAISAVGALAQLGYANAVTTKALTENQAFLVSMGFSVSRRWH